MLNDKNEPGVPFVKPGDSGFARTDLRFSHEYVTPDGGPSSSKHFLGQKTPRVNDPASILFFPRPSHLP